MLMLNGQSIEAQTNIFTSTFFMCKTKIKDTVGPMTDDFGNAILDDGVNVKLLNEYFA